ncbi:unnamed protein product [Mytilus edulis]|uniref:C-type lectin domain-containing protein n=1 Tax=Mytilus edulis TaxID=6550 RepID=A0A8S3U7N6_MYTED|nr:unnamed protein product [Mytilus edulis]
MTIRCFLLSATVYVITVCLLYAVNINAKDVEAFQTEGSTRAIRSLSTSDFHSKSLLICAQTCLSNRQCCVASFSKEHQHVVWIFQKNAALILKPKTDGGLFDEKTIENCICLGGKLLELETSEENEFIKDTVRTLNTGVEGYWIGGYNFNNDNDMEWISKPYQEMPFTDMYPGQPNEPEAQPCMMIWRSFKFRWGDHSCNYPIPYICEFQYT